MSSHFFTDYETKYRAQRQLEAEILPRNKTVLFDALAAAGIATVTIEFEGSGDSGQMEEPCARTADKTIVALPAEAVELERAEWSLELTKETMALPDALEIMAWRLLGETHGGWEDNDGGYGEFAFDLSDRTITLEFHQRYTETAYHEHEF